MSSRDLKNLNTNNILSGGRTRSSINNDSNLENQQLESPVQRDQTDLEDTSTSDNSILSSDQNNELDNAFQSLSEQEETLISNEVLNLPEPDTERVNDNVTTLTMDAIAKNYAAAKDDAGRQAIADAVKAEQTLEFLTEVLKVSGLDGGVKTKLENSLKAILKNSKMTPTPNSATTLIGDNSLMATPSCSSLSNSTISNNNTSYKKDVPLFHGR